MKSWTQHVNGALQVLHLRGKEQLKTRIGHQLFVQLRTAVVSSSETPTLEISDHNLGRQLLAEASKDSGHHFGMDQGCNGTRNW